jgi:hypothetical protein
MRKLLLLLFIVGVSYMGSAQKVVDTQGRYRLRIEKNWSENDAVKKAVEMAIINAIDNSFGSVIVEGNTMYVKNMQNGVKVKSDITFNSISNVLINGEWIRTTQADTSFFDEQGYRWVEINISGKARALSKASFSPKVSTLSCDNLNCATETFNSGQRLTVYFKAPKNGYVAIYLDDSKITQKLLPYSRQHNLSSFKIEADKEYYFFSEKTNGDLTDEIELFTMDNLEQNRMFVLFSETDFTKPILNKLSSGDKTNFPHSTPSIEFQDWLQKLRVYDPRIEMQIIDITIKNGN